MPELPEVETIRRDLVRVLKGKKIVKIELRKAKLVKSNSRTFAKSLKGKKISSLKRRGKLLIIGFSNSHDYLLLHLKMTGQLIYTDPKHLIAGGHGYPQITDLPNKYSHVIFHFTNGATLYFNDLRQFGYLKLVNELGLEQALARFGLEPLTKAFTPDKLYRLLKPRHTALKNALLDQTKIAGLGNIYVDEACFYAGVRPTRRTNKITQIEIKRLHHGIQHILQESIKHRGTTFDSYRDGRGQYGNYTQHLKVYGRAGERCLRPACKRARAIIKKTKVNGRGTSYCPNCQFR